MERISDENASPLIVECLNCGHREYAEIHVSPPWDIDQQELKHASVVVFRPEGRITAEQIHALRELNQDLSYLPVKEAATKISSNPSIDLGTHPLKDAQDLVEKARSLGLNARLESSEENSCGKKNKETWKSNASGMPVSVGNPDDTTVIPFMWVFIGGALVLAVVVWVLLW